MKYENKLYKNKINWNNMLLTTSCFQFVLQNELEVLTTYPIHMCIEGYRVYGIIELSAQKF